MQCFQHGGGNVAVHFRQKAVSRFQQCIHSGKLQSDSTAADDEQVCGQFVRLQQGLTGIYVLALLESVNGRQDRGRPGVDEYFFPLKNCFFLVGDYTDCIFGQERSSSVIEGYIRLVFYIFIIFLTQEGYKLVFPRHGKCIQFGLVLIIVIVSFFRIFRFVNQSFGRDTSYVYTCSSVHLRGTFHDGYFPIPFGQFGGQ